MGNLLSGTYTKVADGSIKNPSITISSPTDKVKAISEIATGGHLEFDVGGILSTHLDVDVAADEAGVAKVRVASGLIPRLPFKNLASASAGSPTGGKPSPWNMVTNLGSGGTYSVVVCAGSSSSRREFVRLRCVVPAKVLPSLTWNVCFARRCFVVVVFGRNLLLQ